MMSRLLYAKPIEHFMFMYIFYIITLFLYFFPIICTIGVAFAFTLHVCLGTVICSFIFFCS